MLHDCLVRQSRSRPNAVAWVDLDAAGSRRTLTWSKIEQLTTGMSVFLKEQGVQPGDRVVHWSANSLQWVLIDLACSVCHACHVPLDPRLDISQARELAAIAQPRLCLVDNCKQRHLTGALVAPSWQSLHSFDSIEQYCVSQPEDAERIANILFTSGTSSSPRGVMLTHRNLIANALGKLDAMPQFPEDHRVNLLPFSHAYARTCELTTWLISGSSMETVNTKEELWSRLMTSKPTLLNLVPLVFNQMFEQWDRRGGEPHQLQEMTGGRLRQWASGGAPIDDTKRELFAKAGLPVHQGYGLTEASPVVCSNRSAYSHDQGYRQDQYSCFDGVGPPILGMECRIDDDSKLWVRGTGVMAGYWNDAEATRARIKNGWLDTGDLAAMTGAQGSLTILGRADDLLVLSNGYKVNPIEIEAFVRRIPGVSDCILTRGNDAVCRLIVNASSPFDVRLDQIMRLLQEQSIPDAHWIKEIQIETDDWQNDKELVNFKGGKRRAAFQKRYGTA